MNLPLLVGVASVIAVVVLAAIGVGGGLLAPILQPAHRLRKLHREPARADFLAGENGLVAEAAADIGRDHAHLKLGNSQHLREPGTHDMRKLRGAVQVSCRWPSSTATKPRHSIGDITWRAVQAARVTLTGAFFAALSTGPS